MAVAYLILLNGPPASGKSTLAKRFVAEHPLALNLDVDIVRGLLGCWIQTPTNAGQAARSLALSMAETHLRSGHDVIVPQFLARPEFIEALHSVASAVGVPFVEVALMLDRATAVSAFAERSKNPTSQSHVDATTLVQRSKSSDPVGEMYDAWLALMNRRPQAIRVDVARGDIDGTYARLTNKLPD